MTLCDPNHIPVYKIQYKSNTLTQKSLEWSVCEDCFGNPKFFGASEEIESIISLKTSESTGLEINHLSIITSTVTKKLKNVLLVS